MSNESTNHLIEQFTKIVESFGATTERFDEAIRDIYKKIEALRADLSKLQTEVAVDDSHLHHMKQALEHLQGEIAKGHKDADEIIKALQNRTEEIATWIAKEKGRQANVEVSKTDQFRAKLISVLIEIGKVLAAMAAGGAAGYFGG